MQSLLAISCATRRPGCRGGRTGSDSEHRQHVTSLAGYENPRSGHRTRVSGGGVRSYGYALSSGLDQARARLGPRPPPSLTPPAGVEPRDCHTGTAALRGLETERKRDETERSPATATPGDSRFTGALMVRDEAFDVAKEEWLR